MHNACELTAIHTDLIKTQKVSPEAKIAYQARGLMLKCCQYMHFHYVYLNVGMAAAQWLGLRLQAIASVLVTLVALLAVLGHEDLLPFATASSKFAASKAHFWCCLHARHAFF